MSYFQTSYGTLQAIAHSSPYEDLAGFLVLARHASGLSHGGFEPYKLSGAGVNSIHEKAGLSEETARGVIERLQSLGVIRPAPPEAKQVFFHARWEIVQGPLDLALPHALVDSLKDGSADSALRRLRKHAIATSGYAAKLTKVSDAELRLDALMTLIAAYRHTSMEAYGGISPKAIYRKWDIKSQTAKMGNVRWGAEPQTDTTYHWFMGECLRQEPRKGKRFEPTELQAARFWNGWDVLKEVGLFYEAVSLFDTPPSENADARLKCTLRVNDYHAGSSTKDGDPSLLRHFESTSGTDYAFYTPQANDRGEPEAMWVLLPDSRGALVGVWRPRFRPATRDVGVWLEREAAEVEHLAALVEHNGD